MYNPNYQEVYNNYYAVLKSALALKGGEILDMSDIQTSLTDNDMGYDTLYETFLTYLLELANFEQSKEQTFLSNYLAQFSKDVELQQKVAQITNAEGTINISQLFNVIEQHRQTQYARLHELPLELTKWQENFEQFSNKFFNEACIETMNELESQLGSLTPQQLTAKLMAGVQTKWEKKFNRGNKSEAFSVFMKQFDPTLTELVKSMNVFKGMWNTPLVSVPSFEGQGTAKIKEGIISQVIKGIVNGLSQEETIVLFGGVSTARTKRTLQYFDSAIKQSVPTETDAYVSLSMNFGINEEITQAIAQAQTDEQIRDYFNSSAEEGWVIHYSSKDLSIRESSKSGAITAKLKGEGSFASKIPILEQMGKAMNNEGKMHKLIFQAINTGKDLIYDSAAYVDEVARSLTSLTLSFMFEDFDDQFRQMVSSDHSTIQELHVYLISGQYYTISDILLSLYTWIKDDWKRPAKRIIRIGFKPAPSVAASYLQFADKGITGKALWETVRNETIKQTKMSVYMQITNLKQMINKISSYKIASV